MQFAPEIQHAKADGWGDMMVCEGLKEMALWLMHESGYPEELQVMNLSQCRCSSCGGSRSLASSSAS